MRTKASSRAACTFVPIVLALSACSAPSRPAGYAASPVTSRRTAPRTAAVIHRSVFGHSLQGRELVSFRVGPADARHRLLFVGTIHGNETAGHPIVQDLLHVTPPATTEIVVVPDLNPDGVVRATRQNAAGVDLNRNFPYRWERLGQRGDQQYSGTRSLSQPESRAMAALVRRLRPTVSVWFHQPVGVVDESGGSVAVESRFARILGLPLRRLQRYHGSAASWENTEYPGTTAFVVELPKRVSAGLRTRVLSALRDLER